jgi:predicted DNA-binding protein with PD1-like motif
MKPVSSPVSACLLMAAKAVRRLPVPERRLVHPGPAAARRFESFEGRGRKIEFDLQPGLSINEAIARPLSAQGIRAASLIVEGGAFTPFHYLMPALSTDGVHAAWYSEQYSPAGETHLECGNVTFGERDGAAFIHCHAIWNETGGRRNAGHILPHETIISQPIRATAWVVENISMVSEPDAETDFTLFHPVELKRLTESSEGSRMVFARVAPNEDIIGSLAAICREHGIEKAAVRGSIGSLIGARYLDGSSVEDTATEVFVLQGVACRNIAATQLEIAMVDTGGTITRGFLEQGKNPVCITFELCLEEVA